MDEVNTVAIEEKVEVPKKKQVRGLILVAGIAAAAGVAVLTGVAVMRKVGVTQPLVLPSGCYYQQVECIQAPCNPVLVCPQSPAATTPRVWPAQSATPTLVPREKVKLNLDNPNWLGQPQKITSIEVFKPGQNAGSMGNLSFDNPTYYKIADWPDGSILIYAKVGVMGPGGGYETVRLVQGQDKKYVYLSTYQTDYTQPDVLQELLPDIKTSDFKIAGLNEPDKISVDGSTLNKAFETQEFFDKLTKPELLTTVDQGRVYIIRQALGTTDLLMGKGYFLRMADNMIVKYDYKEPFMSDNGVPLITWSDGTQNSVGFGQGFGYGGCGMSGTLAGTDRYVVNPTVIAQRTVIGKTKNGDDVYQTTDANNPVVKFLYESEYLNGRDKAQPETLTLESYSKAKSYFLWKDPWGEWRLYASDNFRRMAECGKPVIYLYPTQQTEIKVQVGADINKSEPQYPAGGWKVVAYPGSKISYHGQTYGSLYWEGLGWGEYPILKNKGVVVSQAEVKKTVWNQLESLGLTNKEATEFMEFWGPKLPTNPYVRLTWLGTTEMNKLAPLVIQPIPETLIRVFLESEGLDKPINLTPQKLTSIPRNGFTVVEWGGLLK